MSDQATADIQTVDPMQAYLAEVESVRYADTTGYVDPHTASVAHSEVAEIDGKQDLPEDFDVNGPSEADILRGEEDSAFPSVPDRTADIERQIDEQEDDVDPVEGEEDPEVTEGYEHEEPEAEESAPTKDKGKQFRLRPKDKSEELALTLRKANDKLSLKEAIAQAEAILGIGTEAAKTDDESARSENFPTVQQLEDEVLTLERDWRKAVAAYADDSVTDELAAKIEEAKRNIPLARDHHRQAERQLEAAYEASAAKVVELYPDAEKEGSALRQRMEEIHAALEANGDPLISDPSKPFKIAQMAAKELAIAPKRTVAGVKPSGATKQPVRGKASMTAPLGATRPTSTRPPSQVTQRIEQVQTAEDYESLVMGLAKGVV